MSEIRVIIADDHAIVKDGIKLYLEDDPDIKVVGVAVNGEEAVQLVSLLKPDIAIIDVSMPVMDGIEATKQIKMRNPSTAVLILSAYSNDEFVFALLEVGAAGYLLKDVGGQDVIDAIKAVSRGESVLHPVVARKVMSRFFPVTDMEKEETKILSDREIEVLQLAGKGLNNQDIAGKLGLSSHTIESHMRSIFSKLHVGSRTEAVLYGIKHGWISVG